MSATTSSDLSLSGAFAAARGENRAALIPYVTAGHPRPADTAAILTGLVPLIVYFVSGKLFVRGVAAGAVKG